MKIKEFNLGNMDRVTSNRVAANRYQSTAKTSTPAPKEDGVSFSAAARTVSQAGEAVQSAPDIRMDRVGPIQEAIANGTYDVASSKVADSILRQAVTYRKNA